MLGMAKLGWAGAAVQYRLAPKHKYPAQIEDVRMALAFLRTNAKKYNIDADRIAAVGRSAGGHLGLLLGLAPDENGKTAPGVRAVVNFFGPTDLGSWRINDEGEKVMRQFSPAGLDGIIKDFLGTTDRNAAVTAQAAPITYVRKGSPAVLSLYGSADNIVPLQQAQVLHEALKKAGVTEKMVVYEGKGHGFDYDDAGHGFDAKHPGKAALEMVEFLNQYVKQVR
jgi:acetyl esterase/lipase